MGARGIYTAQEEHIVSVLSPQNSTGGVSGQPINLSNYQHATIIVQLGATAAAGTSFNLFCGSTQGSQTTALPTFDVFSQLTAGTVNDVLGTKTTVTSGSIVPTANANTFYVFEIDTATLPQGSPYVLFSITNGANANYVSAVAILSAGRFTGDQSATATV